MSIRCPVCGENIQPESIPDVHNASFTCPRCRTQLEVTTSDPVPMLAISVALSVMFSFLLGVRGFAFFGVTVVVAAIFYWVGKLLRSFLAAPKLERSRSRNKLLHLGKRIPSAR